MIRPLATYEIGDIASKTSVNFVWGKVFKKRYCVEVQHTSLCKGNLIIFDGQNSFRVIHEEPVVVHYDGKPLDKMDIEAWENLALGYLR